MAKTNKFTSINFNHIYDKNLSTNSNPNSTNRNPNSPIKTPSSSSSSSFSYSAISSPNNKTHGRMLVLTRPTPKPISIPPPISPQPQSQPQPQPQLQSQPQQTRQGPIRSDSVSDAISLRPLGRIGSSPPILSPVPSHGRDKEATGFGTSPKPDKFVPPHLRPGFVAKEDRSRPDVIRGAAQRHSGPPVWYGEDGRPKSGGGNERMMRGGGDSDLAMMTRPRSSGSRPSSTGW